MRHPTQLALAAIPLAILLIGSLAGWLPQSPPLLFATAAAGVLFVIEIFAPSMRRYIARMIPAAIVYAILLIGDLAGLPPTTAILVTIAAAVMFLVIEIFGLLPPVPATRQPAPTPAPAARQPAPTPPPVARQPAPASPPPSPPPDPLTADDIRDVGPRPRTMFLAAISVINDDPQFGDGVAVPFELLYTHPALGPLDEELYELEETANDILAAALRASGRWETVRRRVGDGAKVRFWRRIPEPPRPIRKA